MSDVERIQEQLTFKHFRRFLKIRDRRTGRLITLNPNSVQRRIRAEIISQMRSGHPVRVIILKSRRMGASTIIQATLAHIAFVTADFAVITGAHEDKSSEYLHSMTETMWRSLPAPIRPTKEVGIRGKHLSFTHGSSLETFTAGNGAGVGRGGGWRAMHVSELGFWRNNPSETLQGLRQTIPNEPETVVVIESTANGNGGAFYDEWQRAVAGETEYVPLFFAWHEFEDYTRPFDVPDSVGLERLGTLDDDELALRKLGVTDEQLNWRRHTIANECGGSLDVFHQEYPATPEEAFLSSGRPYFESLARFDVAPPKLVGDLSGEPVRGGAVRFTRSPGGPVTIWDAPKQGKRYIIGADVAGSTVLSQHSSRPAGTKTDAYCAYCVEVDTGRTVACLYGRGWTEPQYAEKLAQLGRLFFDAEIAVEKAMGYGMSTVTLLRQLYAYPRQWRRLDEDSDETNDESGEFGFPMTSTTRPIVLADLSEALRDRPGALRDASLLGEMRTFVWNDRGRPEADTGAHDDRVMAMAITQHVRNLRATRPYRVESPAQVEQRAKQQKLAAKRAASPIVRRAPRGQK